MTVPNMHSLLNPHVESSWSHERMDTLTVYLAPIPRLMTLPRSFSTTHSIVQPSGSRDGLRKGALCEACGEFRSTGGVVVFLMLES